MMMMMMMMIMIIMMMVMMMRVMIVNDYGYDDDDLNHDDDKYYDKLVGIKKYFHEIFFIETKHVNNFTANWKNEKILLLIRNDLK